MQLESARAELRLRGPGEAMDLGLLLLRALWWPALRAWLGVVLPLQLLVLALAWQLHVGAWLLLLVWLAPLFDRVWILLLGQGLFGPPPGVRALWAALLRRGHRGLLGDLLWRRPDAPRRPLFLPVTLLEGLGAAAAQRRRRLLVATHTSSVWTMWAGRVLIELATLVGLMVLGWMLLPEEAHWTPGMTLGFDSGRFFSGALVAAFLIANGLTEAMFVAAGFGLYVNGRTRVEGWDVELVFRRMARRLSRGARAAVLLLAWGLLGAALPALAQSPEGEPPPEGPWEPLSESAQPPVTQPLEEPAQSQSALRPEFRRPAPLLRDEAAAAQALERVRARPEFSHKRYEERWVLRDFSDDAEAQQPSDMPEWVLALAQALAGGIRFVLWGAVILAAGGFLYMLLVQLQRASHRVRDEVAATQAARVDVAGAPQREISAAEALGHARALAAQGRRGEALAMLYVGMIAGFTVRWNLDVPARATEQQCLRLVDGAPVGEAGRALFAEVVQRRLHVAYGHADIPEGQLQQLCGRYARVFGVRP